MKHYKPFKMDPKNISGIFFSAKSFCSLNIKRLQGDIYSLITLTANERVMLLLMQEL